MNYCRKCQSDYEKPGTCNCFAPQAAPIAPTITPTPWAPHPWTPSPLQPTIPNPWITGPIWYYRPPYTTDGTYVCTSALPWSGTTVTYT